MREKFNYVLRVTPGKHNRSLKDSDSKIARCIMFEFLLSCIQLPRCTARIAHFTCTLLVLVL